MILVYIDYVAVLNSVSHLYLDKALKRGEHQRNRERYTKKIASNQARMRAFYPIAGQWGGQLQYSLTRSKVTSRIYYFLN